MQKHITDKPNYNTLTKEQLALGIIKTKKEVRKLKEELEKVKSYLREQHKLKKELEQKVESINLFLLKEHTTFENKRK